MHMFQQSAPVPNGRNAWPAASPSNGDVLSLPNRPDHSVHFYNDDASLFEVAADFLARGLQTGQSAVVIATQPHRDAFRRTLQSRDVDVDAAERSGRLIFRDADSTLSQFMLGGMPDEALFEASVGALIQQQLAVAGEPGLRAFGEMVDVLWRNGEREAAIRLEALWHRLAEK